MTLNIERYNRFSYLWRFEPNTPNGFGEILFYKLEILQRMYVSFNNFFCHSAISQILMAEISFNIACKGLKIKQIAQLNQLFQFLHLVHISGHGWSYANEEKCKQWRRAGSRFFCIEVIAL